jgi:hypothetical protein
MRTGRRQPGPRLGLGRHLLRHAARCRSGVAGWRMRPWPKQSLSECVTAISPAFQHLSHAGRIAGFCSCPSSPAGAAIRASGRRLQRRRPIAQRHRLIRLNSAARGVTEAVTCSRELYCRWRHARRTRLPHTLVGLTRIKCAGTPSIHGSSPASMNGALSASVSR